VVFEKASTGLQSFVLDSVIRYCVCSDRNEKAGGVGKNERCTYVNVSDIFYSGTSPSPASLEEVDFEGR